MNLIYLVLLCGCVATSFVHKSEARLHAESIVGGAAAAVGQYTYAVSIQNNYHHFCGGGILNNRYIITSAHCFINAKTNKFINREFIVVAGVTKAHNKEEQNRVTREVAKIYIPRVYNPIIKRNIGNHMFADIAVLELTSNLGLNQFITNIVLPPNARLRPTYENQQAVVNGYGHSWVTMRHDPRLNRDVEDCSGSDCYEQKFAQVKILSNMACRNIFRSIMDSQLCGRITQRSPANPEGLCKGDSGSPLVLGNTIIGVVSTSPMGCREDVKPSVYTRVAWFLPFITDAMNGVWRADMRLAKYEVGRSHRKVLVEQ